MDAVASQLHATTTAAKNNRPRRRNYRARRRNQQPRHHKKIKSEEEKAHENLVALAPGNFSTPRVWLRDHETLLARLIREHARGDRFVVGCVAWLTNRTLLKALQRARNVAGALVQFVVNKETYLKQASHPATASYRSFVPLTLAEAQLLRGEEQDGKGRGSSSSSSVVRCCGTSGGDLYTPRMHHKFAVFGQVLQRPPYLVPERAVVGSFNWTHTATRSLETCVVVDAEEDVRALFREFCQVLGVSEPLHYARKRPSISSSRSSSSSSKKKPV